MSSSYPVSPKSFENTSTSHFSFLKLQKHHENSTGNDSANLSNSLKKRASGGMKATDIEREHPEPHLTQGEILNIPVKRISSRTSGSSKKPPLQKPPISSTQKVKQAAAMVLDSHHQNFSSAVEHRKNKNFVRGTEGSPLSASHNH